MAVGVDPQFPWFTLSLRQGLCALALKLGPLPSLPMTQNSASHSVCSWAEDSPAPAPGAGALCCALVQGPGSRRFSGPLLREDGFSFHLSTEAVDLHLVSGEQGGGLDTVTPGAGGVSLYPRELLRTDIFAVCPPVAQEFSCV